MHVLFFGRFTIEKREMNVLNEIKFKVNHSGIYFYTKDIYHIK